MNAATAVKGQIVVIADDGKNLGTMDAYVARQLAYDKGLDLVCVQPDARPPVCRIIDKGKWEYEKKKKDRANRQHNVTTKEIRFSINIADHDLGIKVNHMRDMLGKGHPVKISVKMRGREVAHADIAFNLVTKISESLKDCAKIDKIHKVDKSVFATAFPV